MNYLGLDIGGTAVKIGLISPRGTVLCKDSFPAAFDGYETPLMQTALRSARLFLDSRSIGPDTLGGIGVSATGQIDPRAGTVVGTAGHIPNWVGAPIRALLEDEYGLPVSVINDADSVALAEQWVGNAAGYTHVVVVTVGTGVGGGILTDGGLLTGSRLPGGRAAAGLLIFKLAGEGHAGIARILDTWIGYVAAGLIGLTHIFNPERILVGGGVCRQEALFIEPLRKKVLEGVMPRFKEALTLEAAGLGNDAGMIGAIRGLVQG